MDNISKDIEHRSVDRKWIEIKKDAKEVIGKERRVRNEEWFNDECRIAIEWKNADRLIMMQTETRQNYERYKESRSRSNKILRGISKGMDERNRGADHPE
jgi:hypothetical protein